MNNFTFWQKWLIIVGLTISGFGILIAFSNQTGILELFGYYINPVFWSGNAMSFEIKEFQKFIYGVLGATVAGWGIMITFIAHYPFRKKEIWSWHCLFVALLVWYITDTSISLYFKVYFNVILNSILFVLIILPLIFSKKYFSNMNTVTPN